MSSRWSLLGLLSWCLIFYLKPLQFIWPGAEGRIPGRQFNIKMTSYQYRKSHRGDKTILRPSYLHNGVSYTGKTTSLYWIGALYISSSDAWSSLSCRDLTAWQPWQQGSWDQYGAHLGPTGPRWAPCWPHELCYLGGYQDSSPSTGCQTTCGHIRYSRSPRY